MHEVIRGGIAGFVGTAAMTAVIAAERVAGLMRDRPAPEIIGANIETAMGVRDMLPDAVFQVSWLLQHFGYGTNAGVGYALLEKRLPVGKPVLGGALYGIALYLVGYAGWLPLLGLYPPPARNPGRKVAMLVAEHIVFATTMALTYRGVSARA